MSLSPTEGVEYDFDLGIEFGSDPSNGVYCEIILYAHRAIWHYLMLKKDFHTDYLSWYLLLQEFNFVVHDKRESGDVGEPIEKLLPTPLPILCPNICEGLSTLKECFLGGNPSSF